MATKRGVAAVVAVWLDLPAGLTHHLFRAYAPPFPAFLRVFHGN